MARFLVYFITLKHWWQKYRKVKRYLKMVDEIPKLPDVDLPDVSGFDKLIQGVYKTIFIAVFKPLKKVADWFIQFHDWVKKKAGIELTTPDDDVK